MWGYKKIHKNKNSDLSIKIGSEVEDCCENPCIKNTDGNQVCTNCGTILGQVYASNEQRAYTLEEVKRKRHTEPSWREYGPRTILPSIRRDSKGKTLNNSKRLKFSRLSKIQRSLITSQERNYWEARPKLKRYASSLNVPKYIRETAWRIYVEVTKKKLTMGRSIDGFVAASLYAAIRIHEFPRLLDDVSDGAMVPNHTLYRSLSLIINDILPILGLDYHPVSIKKLIFAFGNKLDLPIEMQIKALNILKYISKKYRCFGKDPKGLAAALLYFVIKESKTKRTQAEVAIAAKVSEVTIRSRVKDIKLLLDY
ncbi:MAG: transcription initiation factor IIB [Promethearchaeota archaeon]